MQQHELRHDFRQRVAPHHLVVALVHGGVAVVEVVVVGLCVHFFLHAVHVAQILYVIRVGEGKPVFRVCEIGEYFLAVHLGLVVHSVADIHQVHVVVHVQPVDVVGEACVEFVEGVLGGCHVL